jgi:mannose-6-phosphate isomerase
MTQYVDVQAGDTLFIRPGTIHALGPGLLIYEVQQSSDITYRVYDWGRPQTEKRMLHIEKSLAVTNPLATAPVIRIPEAQERQILARCNYFTLEGLSGETQPLKMDTAGQTFHTITVIEGQAQITTGQSQHILGRFETVFIPADCGTYQIVPMGKFRALKASVEPV